MPQTLHTLRTHTNHISNIYNKIFKIQHQASRMKPTQGEWSCLHSKQEPLRVVNSMQLERRYNRQWTFQHTVQSLAEWPPTTRLECNLYCFPSRQLRLTMQQLPYYQISWVNQYIYIYMWNFFKMFAQILVFRNLPSFAPDSILASSWRQHAQEFTVKGFPLGAKHLHQQSSVWHQPHLLFIAGWTFYTVLSNGK